MPDIPPPAAACLRAEFHEAMSMRCAECGYQPGPGSAARCVPNKPGAARGVYCDYCPTCGAWNGSPCLTPGGRERDDHASRAPGCNANGATCNKHGKAVAAPRTAAGGQA